GRSSSQRDGGTTREARRAARAAVDPRRGASDRAAPSARLAHGEREAREGEGRGDGGRGCEGDGAGPGAGAAGADPAGEGGARGRSSSERDGGTAREARRAGRATGDPCRGASDCAAPGARRGDREGKGLKGEGRGDRRRR